MKKIDVLAKTFDADLFSMVQISGNDCDSNHTIMLCDGWIFDSNHKHIITFCQEGLNWCCSSKEKMGIYEWCPLLYKFEHNKIKHNE